MKASVDEQWARYGRALIGSMSEVLGETPDDIHANLLETADYWLSVGLVLGLREPEQAQQLLQVIEAYEAERGELVRDAKTLIGQVFEWGAVGGSRRCPRRPAWRTTSRRSRPVIPAASRAAPKTRSWGGPSVAPASGVCSFANPGLHHL